MPSSYSSQHSRDDAKDLAARTGLSFREVPIAPIVEAFLAQLHLTGLAEENLQARVRGTTLMGISNQEGHLVLATGNKSELAVGYSTLYGDAVGAYAPLKDDPQDPGVGAVPVAQRHRRVGRRDRPSRRAASTSRRPPSCDPASSTPTRFPTTGSWTTSSMTTSSRTVGRPTSSPQALPPTSSSES